MKVTKSLESVRNSQTFEIILMANCLAIPAYQYQIHLHIILFFIVKNSVEHFIQHAMQATEYRYFRHGLEFLRV